MFQPEERSDENNTNVLLLLIGTSNQSCFICLLMLEALHCKRLNTRRFGSSKMHY